MKYSQSMIHTYILVGQIVIYLTCLLISIFNPELVRYMYSLWYEYIRTVYKH